MRLHHLKADLASANVWWSWTQKSSTALCHNAINEADAVDSPHCFPPIVGESGSGDFGSRGGIVEKSTQ
jgi:hypothetical protein